MDREQAIKIIKDCKEKSFKRTLYTLNEYHEAIDMAIEALEQEPTDAVQRTSNANKKHIENTLEDAISRQAAIDAIENTKSAKSEDGEIYVAKINAEMNIQLLPSVSTENPNRSKFEFDEEQEQLDFVQPHKKIKVNLVPCEDAISRQAAIDAMATWDWQELYLPIHFKQLLEELPSVNPQDCDKCEVGNPCLYCKHKFEPQESEVSE